MASNPVSDPELRKAATLMLQAAAALDCYCAKRGEDEDLKLEVATATYLRTRADRLVPPSDAWPKDGKGEAKVIDLQTWKRKA